MVSQRQEQHSIMNFLKMLTLYSVELIFYRNIIGLLCSTDLDFVTTISLNLGPGDVPKKVRIIVVQLGLGLS